MEKLSLKLNLNNPQKLHKIELKSNLKNFPRPNGTLNGHIVAQDHNLLQTYFLPAFWEKFRSAFGSDSRTNSHLIRKPSIHFSKAGEKWVHKPEILQQILTRAKETGIPKYDARQKSEDLMGKIWECAMNTMEQEEADRLQNPEQISSYRSVLSPIVIKSGLASLGALWIAAGGYWLWKHSQPSFFSDSEASLSKDSTPPTKIIDEIESFNSKEQPAGSIATNTSTEQFLSQPVSYPFSPVPNVTDFFLNQTNFQHPDLDSELRNYPNSTPNFFTEPEFNSSYAMTHWGVCFLGLSTLYGLGSLLYRRKQAEPLKKTESSLPDKLDSSVNPLQKEKDSPSASEDLFQNDSTSSDSVENSLSEAEKDSPRTYKESSENKSAPLSIPEDSPGNDRDSLNIPENSVRARSRSVAGLTQQEITSSLGFQKKISLPLNASIPMSDPVSLPWIKNRSGSPLARKSVIGFFSPDCKDLDKNSQSKEETESKKIPSRSYRGYMFVLAYALHCLETNRRGVVAVAFEQLLNYGAEHALKLALACLEKNSMEAKEVVAIAFDKFLEKKQNSCACEFAVACLEKTPRKRKELLQ